MKAILLQGEKDDKIIAVCADDPEFRHYDDIKQIPPHRLAEIRRFFEDCILLWIESARAILALASQLYEVLLRFWLTNSYITSLT